MNFYNRSILLIIWLFGAFLSVSVAQSITIQPVDNGPYTAGSSIAIKLTAPCNAAIKTNNVYTLYLSDASGSFAAPTAIGTYNGFYTTFVNGVLPTGIATGSGYQLQVRSSVPALTSNAIPINITNGSRITAGINGAAINTDPTNPVFGNCSPNGTYSFNFNNDASKVDNAPLTSTATVDVQFFNQGTQAVQNSYSTDAVNRAKTFPAPSGNYTVFVTTKANGVVGTRAYLLLNSVINTNFGTSGNTSVCLGTELTFTVDISSAGIGSNYAGTLYNVNWGDNNSNTYTYCDIAANNGKISHQYNTSSCGSIVNGRNNVFKIDLEAKNPYCPVDVANTVTTYAKVSAKPLNKIAPVLYACTNTPISFANQSNPGEDPNNTSPGCIFSNAKYSWSVNGDLKENGYALGQQFTYTFPTAGTYTIKLDLENNPSTCSVASDVITVCVQDKPTAAFSLPSSTVCISAGEVAPVNNTVVDNTCYTGNQYTWTIIPDGTWPAATFAPGTDLHSKNPRFRFTGPGIYKINMNITDACGGIVAATEKRLVVDASPTVSLQPDVSFCGFTVRDFRDEVSVTRVRYTGTPDPAAAVYKWTVTALDGQAPATFVNGTQQSDEQYPRINFPGYGRYQVSVQQIQNAACGASNTAVQIITIQQSPSVIAGNNVAICATDGSVSFNGSISDMSSVASMQWLSTGDGAFTNRNTRTPTYNLGPNDKQGGNFTITFDVNTTLAGTCSNIKSTLTLSVTPKATVTPVPAQSICTGQPYQRVITSPNSSNYVVTFNWTTTTSANISGVGTSGSGATINDVPVNSSATTPGTITYRIVPTIFNGNGLPCVGDAYDMVVTVNPLPVLIPPTAPPVCSGLPVNIALASNLPGTRYTWTSSVTSGSATGNQQRPVATAATAIQDVITNTGTTDAVITYIITPIGSTGCLGTSVPVAVTINPQPSTANAGSNQDICNQTSYTLNGNIPAVGTGTWTEATGTVTFVDIHDPQTIVNNLVPGQTYRFTWTIANQCNSNQNTIQVVNYLPANAGNASTAINPICSGTGGTLTLSGSIVATVTTWQQLAADGVTWNNIASTVGNTTYTFPPLTATSTFRALVRNGACSVAASQPVTITVNPGTPAANAGADKDICNQTSYTLTGNTAVGFTGSWSQISGPPATIVSPASATTDVSGLVGGNVYTFRWTINGQAPCGNATDDVVINNLGQITNTVTPPPATVCSGSTVNLTGSIPTGGNNTYTYIWESSTDNGTTWAVLAGQTGRNASAVITAQTTFRRTVISSLCSRVSNQVSVDIQAGIGNNVIDGGNPSVCYNLAPNVISGRVPTGGGGAYTYTWEQSTDGINFTTIPGATQQNYQPPALTATTTYRRIVSTALCVGLPSTSNALTIVVNPNVSAFFTATKQNDCAPFIITSQMISATADANAVKYTWFANNVKLAEGLAFPGYRIDADGQTVIIKLQVESASGCNIGTYTRDFTTQKQVVASFTTNGVTSGCGPTTITFTNTSNQVPGATYFWDFGDGQTSTLTSPTHTFQPRADGKDAVYTVILTPGGCLPTPSQPLAITVYPAKPVAAISTAATTGCGPYTITVDNLSPGTNKGYLYRLFRGNAPLPFATIPSTDKSSVSFAPQNPATATTYWIDMVATNNCDQTNTSDRIPITITPSGTTALMSIPTQPGCAPLVATFNNFSNGGSRFEFTIRNAANQIIDVRPATNTNPINYTFTQPGTYSVTVTAFNSCSTTGLPSQTNYITVYESPTADFTADNTLGCKELKVKFTNPGSSAFSYHWDFGDGTTSDAYQPEHTFDYKKSPYTVTLTAKNNSDCSNTVTKAGYITVNPPTFPEFTADPGFTTAIPNYHFQFNDRTTGNPVSWSWSFGDGQSSTNRNPSHTYADTGKYEVTLTTKTALGCDETVKHEVRITGIPGQLYIPNAFMPSSGTEELRRFTVKGAGIKQWRMRIFDNWGQLVFETTKLNERGEPTDYWDGTFRGQPVKQGVYAWEISASFINGQEWRGMTYKSLVPKRSGTVTLLR